MVRSLGLALILASGGTPAVSQERPGSVQGEDCDLVSMTIRLRLYHPLGATRSADRQCLANVPGWVETTAMDPRQRMSWRRAVARLYASEDAACRLAARTLVWMERIGGVSVWSPADTANGMVYFGATYLTEAASPLALHLWSRAFDRSGEWLAAALAHEAYHLLEPGRSEDDAVGFGERCGNKLGSDERPTPESTDPDTN